MAPVIPMARPAGAVRGPPTQPAGMAPLAPGESILVVAPSRRAREPGELNLLPLVLVGVVFAALGIGLTLWIMLADHPTETTAAASATAEPGSEPTGDVGPRWPLRAPPRVAPPPRGGTGPPVAPPPGPGIKQHGKGPHGR